MRKKDVLEILDRMADEIDVDRLMYTLYLRRKLELGLADIASGHVITHEEVEQEMEEWRD